MGGRRRLAERIPARARVIVGIGALGAAVASLAEPERATAPDAPAARATVQAAAPVAAAPDAQVVQAAATESDWPAGFEAALEAGVDAQGEEALTETVEALIRAVDAIAPPGAGSGYAPPDG
jgi:hypothetical protein